MRAVARAEPAVILALYLAGLLTERDAAEMGTDAENHQKLRLLDTGLVLFGITQLGAVDGVRARDLVSGPVTDENRLATPGDRDGLPFSDCLLYTSDAADE